MQDPRTGMMEQLTEEQYKMLTSKGFKTKEEALKYQDNTPVPANVPRFRVGEIVQVNDGWFRIRKITKKDLVLRAIPKPVVSDSRQMPMNNGLDIDHRATINPIQVQITAVDKIPWGKLQSKVDEICELLERAEGRP